MSAWVYVNGTITLSPMGRTQAEKRYILDTVLAHLPLVTGSERDMNTYVIQKKGYNSSSSHDEYGYRTDNLTDGYGSKCRRRGSLRVQDEYILVIDGSLRDREFEETFKELVKYLCRLSDRIAVDDVFVKINAYDREKIITNKNDSFGDMYTYPSWSFGGEKDNYNWCEHLMWSE